MPREQQEGWSELRSDAWPPGPRGGGGGCIAPKSYLGGRCNNQLWKRKPAGLLVLGESRPGTTATRGCTPKDSLKSSLSGTVLGWGRKKSTVLWLFCFCFYSQNPEYWTFQLQKLTWGSTVRSGMDLWTLRRGCGRQDSKTLCKPPNQGSHLSSEELAPPSGLKTGNTACHTLPTFWAIQKNTKALNTHK